MKQGAGWIAVAAFTLAAGCAEQTLYVSYVGDGGGSGSGGAGAGGGGAADECTGECLPLAPADWTDFPVLMWVGDEEKEPQACPPAAPAFFYRGHEHLNVTSQCDVCTCSDPVCALPAGLTANDAPMCQGGMLPPWDAPPGWDGSCIAPGALPSDKLASVTIAPTGVSACKSGTQPAPAKLTPPSWAASGYACRGISYGRCKDPGTYCVPAPVPMPSPGFQECIEYTRDDIDNVSCPAAYPVPHVFYHEYEDSRFCTPCECDPPVGSACSAMVSLYEDEACATVLYSHFANTTSAQCIDTAIGKPLGSMSAVMVDDDPGTCEPRGGVLMGAVTPEFARMFCCRSSP
jgi:hypothetical protein